MATERGQNERALVRAAQRGDKEALQLLFRSNWAWLKGLVYSIVQNADDIDDTINQSFEPSPVVPKEQLQCLFVAPLCRTD